MMLALPGPLPVTCGAVVGWVAPAGIVTVAGEILTFELLLESVTTVPPAGAALDKVTWNAAD